MRGRISALDVFAAVSKQHRTALPVGDEVQAHRRIRHQELLGRDVAFEEAAPWPPDFLGQAIRIKPSHLHDG